MMGLNLGRYALSSCVAAAMLAGCGGSQPPIGAPGAMQQSSALQSQSAQRDDGGSWMASDAASQNLLYVSNVHDVTVYSYPHGRLVGKLKGFYVTGGECVDASQNVWITDLGHGRMVEYAHGGSKPLRILSGIGGAGCAIDPTTGNLAVATLGGTVYVYKNASGTPTPYSDPDIGRFYYCGYDDKGNLFADGEGSKQKSYSPFELGELVPGGSALKTITLNQVIGGPAGVQWDGRHLAVGDGETPVIYEFAIKRRQGTKVGTTPLGSTAEYITQFWIHGRTVIAPNQYSSGDKNLSDVLFYNYPSGGSAIKTIAKGVFFPHGAVVSKANR
jgi:hypothetical protein